MNTKYIILSLAGAFALALSSCTAGGSAQGSGMTTTSDHGRSTTSSGAGQISGSGYINRN